MQDFDEVDPMPERDDPDHDFWSQTDELAHVHTFARSRGASPYATLGSVLRRATASIEPYVVLPPTVGGQASLNLFTASVGVSGGGKDLANAAGRDAVDFVVDLGNGNLVPADPVALVNPGSGEGLARIFAGHKDQPGVTRAQLEVPDVATLEALAGRKGQTLVSQLLAAFMGQPIGFHNAQRETTTAAEAHSYRLCLSVGVQPDNAGFFLSREKDGLPQRYVWLPTIDPYAPEARAAKVNPLTVVLPTFTLPDGAQRVEMPIPGEVADEIWHFNWQVRTGAEGIDPLDGHIKLTQLKLAASIAILHSKTEVTDEAWKIAAQLIEVSGQVRERLRAAVADRARRENTARAHDQADRQAIIDARLTDDRQKRVAQAITRKLKRVGRAKRIDLRRACDTTIRSDFDPVFDLFLDKGLIVCCGGGEGRADEYILAPE